MDRQEYWRQRYTEIRLGWTPIDTRPLRRARVHIVGVYRTPRSSGA